jgi:hypothetical protein
MSKTPEQMAEEYCEDHDECEFARDAFLAGYQAAQHKDKAVNRTHLAWKLAEDYGAVKWLKHKNPKRFGNTERDYEYTIARDGFYQGYQAAKDEYKTKISELEIELENWKHTAIHGDEGL